MKSHGLDMIGNLHIESESSVPTWAATDERRLIYVSNKLYYGGTSDWNEVAAIPAGTKMWFYADTAPVGWTIDSTPSDNILAVKGGSTYTTGGVNNAGSWTVSGITTDTHAGHTHYVSGSTSDYVGGSLRDEGGGSNTCTPAHTHTVAFSSQSGGSHSHVVSQAGTWRPRANVGIICSKD